MSSKQLQINVKDRVRAAYDLDIRALAISGDEADAGTPQDTYIKELSREFCSLFDEQEDPAAVSEEQLMQILQNLRLDGEPLSFFDGREIKNKEAAMAYAMLQIRSYVLYSENPESSDHLYHVFLAGDENLHLTDAREAIRLREGSGVNPQRYRDMYDNIRQDDLLRQAQPKPQQNQASAGAAQAGAGSQTDAPAPTNAGAQANAQNPATAGNQANTQNPTNAQTPTYAQNPATAGNQERNKITFSQLVSGLSAFEAGMKSGSGHRDSQLYLDVTAALKNVTDNWDKPVDEAGNLDAMLSAYKQLDTACRAYIREREGAISPLGRRRLGIISDILKLQEKERVVLEVYKKKTKTPSAAAANRQTVFDIAKEARTVDMSGQTQKIGAAMSTRILIKSGPDIGIFTEDHPFPKTFTELVLNMVDAADTISEGTKDNIRAGLVNSDWFDRMKYMQNGGEFMQFFREKGLLPQNGDTELQNAYAALADAIDRRLTEKVPRTIDAGELKAFISNSSIPQTDKDTLSDAIDANKRLHDIIRSKRECDLSIYIPEESRSEAESEACKKLRTEIVNAAKSSLATHIQAGIRPENIDNLNNRSIATSVMASLMGCPDLVAQAQKADYVGENNVRVPGMFMEFAPGIGGDDISGTYRLNRPSDLLLNEAGIKKQIADMQVLDLICGQGDRHMNNIRWNCDSLGRIVSIKGIDHDMSFGEFDITNLGGHSVPLGLVRVVDQTTCDFIQDLARPENRALIEYKFKDLLKASEIDALCNRIDTMSKWLASDNVKKIPTAQWKDQKWNDLMLVGSTARGSTHTPMNLFSKVGILTLPLSNASRRTGFGQCDRMISEGNDFEKNTRFERETANGQHRWALHPPAAENEQNLNRTTGRRQAARRVR